MSSSLSFKASQTQASSNPHSSARSEHKQQPAQQTVKLLKNLNKFVIDGRDYYVALIRQSAAPCFRVSIVDKETCWTSTELQFDKIRNEALSGSLSDFRNHLISALSDPNDPDYEIEAVIHPNKTNLFEIKILRKAVGLSVLLTNIKLYRGKNNLFYLLEKASVTIQHQKGDNSTYRRDNRNFQKKYTDALQLVEEAISVKNKQEQQLLSKFVVILNEKKKKIRALQQEIDRLKGKTHTADTYNAVNAQMRMDESMDATGDNVMDVDEDESKHQKQDINSDALLQPMDNDSNDSTGFHVSFAEINAYDPDLEAQSPEFGTNQKNVRRKKKKNILDLTPNDNRNNKRKRKATCSVLEDASLGMSNADDCSTLKRKKRRREYDNEETLESASFVAPVQKKRKVSTKQEKDGDESDSSYDFNTSDLV